MIVVTLRCQLLAYDEFKFLKRVSGVSMIDAVVAVGVFTALGLCIVGFGAWTDKRGR